jgi:hypothetical protein
LIADNFIADGFTGGGLLADGFLKDFLKDMGHQLRRLMSAA